VGGVEKKEQDAKTYMYLAKRLGNRTVA